jgi:chorismate mutase / prephenate dehydratase
MEELRKQIDDTDAEIVRLISRRISLAGEIGRQKNSIGKPVEDTSRERIVLDHVRGIAKAQRISEQDVEAIYQQVIIASKRIQGASAAFQGEIGAYGEEAAANFFGPDVHLEPCASFDDVFTTVSRAKTQFGVVPVENSLEGSINRVYDLLLNSNLMVCGEIEVRIAHCLIGNPGANLSSVRKVYSHPQALAQSQRFLKNLKAELIPAYDTAGSVKNVKERGSRSLAAVASARAADIYEMSVLAKEIEDNSNNFTRFFILGANDAPPSGNDKTSLVFSLNHRPGALYEALNEFARRQINLVKIESRPTRQKLWDYNFYVDFEGHRTQPEAQEAIASLSQHTFFVKVLGSYPKYKQEGNRA